jgi:hypothetical protein
MSNAMTRRVLLLLIVLMLVGTPSGSGQATKSNNDIAIVVHPDTPVTGLNMDEVRQVFRGERQYWPKNIPVVLIMRAPVSREREVVLRKIFEMNDSQFKQYWVGKIFRAETTSAPKIVYSNTMASQLVSAVPGAIAFMDSKDLKPGLKVLPINGILPGQPNYPIR